jgi:hypothetical protein
MGLTQKEYSRFLGVKIRLMHFVGSEKGELPKDMSVESFSDDMDIATKLSYQEALYKNPEYFEKFAKDNPYNLSAEDVETAYNFRHFKKGSFWLLKYLKNHTIFLDDRFAYGVLALGEPFEAFFGNEVPRLIETVLLPFNGKIVYDGVIRSSALIAGTNATASLKNEYNILKARYGLITQLPIDENILNKQVSEEEKLITYMKSKSSADQNWYHIEKMIENRPWLRNLHQQLWGKLNAKNKKKVLNELGIKGFHHAITGDTLVASGKSKQDVEAIVKSMMDDDMWNAIHYFKS